jgi:hypothetical protein
MMTKLAGAPPDTYAPGKAPGITNPALSQSLQEILESPNPIAFFQKFIPMLIGFGFVIGTIIFFFIMMVGAIQWISSGGDKASVEQARGKVLNAVVGIVILFATFALIKVIEIFFGTNILELDIGPLKIE